MGRGLSVAAKAYSGPFVWAVTLTLRDASTENYAGQAITFLGTTYTGYLKAVPSVHLQRGFPSDSAEIDLSNADTTISTLLKTKAFEGSMGELKKLLLGIEEEYPVVAGLVTEESQDVQAARFRITSGLNPSGIRVPTRELMGRCQWRFKSNRCGYAGGLTTCDKDWGDCTTRAQTHRFSGVPVLTAEMIRIVQLTPGTGPFFGRENPLGRGPINRGTRVPL